MESVTGLMRNEINERELERSRIFRNLIDDEHRVPVAEMTE
jgi:hypothetical protein